MTLAISTQLPDASAVLALATTIEAEDGAPPLSDQTLSQVSDPDVTHLAAYDGDRLAGYAQLDGETLEIAADSEAGPELLAAAGDGILLVWSHGRRSRLLILLERGGFVRERELHQLRRPLDEDHPLPPEPDLAEGIVVRTFRPGADDDAWLALNAAAFATHPEQGGWDRRDLRARMSEPWFDPEGFLVAERAGALVGFHWTKIHAPAADAAGLGEVYVLGVSPDAQRLGLGRGLLLRGLHHLGGRGCPAALLYVDGDNQAAINLYARDGFVTHDLDVQWRRS